MTMLRSVLLLFMIFSMGDAASCPYGWKNYGLRCYKYFSHSVDWITAEKTCQNNGGNLASVYDKSLNDFLMSLMPIYQPCWGGGHDSVKEGRWLWSNGDVFHYNNWCSGQPSDLYREEHCMEINVSTLRCWSDEPCSRVKAFLCVKKL